MGSLRECTRILGLEGYRVEQVSYAGTAGAALPWYTAPRYLLRDRDGLCANVIVSSRITSLGIHDRRIAPRAPGRIPTPHRRAARAALTSLVRGHRKDQELECDVRHITSTAEEHGGVIRRRERLSGFLNYDTRAV